ncbi:MAG: hypothetical protein O2821_08250 [Chloroflexi bacterium]|nr:hypothetical protein [Chloroflexota bacterium]MDA1227010.1 hypothetical protein [Chloroflexota bacterium]
MNDSNLSDDAPGTILFPQFEDLIYDMIAVEVSGLADQHLDFESDRWGWSAWSIRRNVSHMASGDFRWLLQRWGKRLFTKGVPQVDDLDRILSTEFDRRLDENVYWQIEDITGVLRRSLDLAWSVLSQETVASLRSKELRVNIGGLPWAEVHPNGVRVDPADPTQADVTLEATFRHRYFEYITHLYNIQRLKRAQGLTTSVNIPFEGYWAAKGWDRSEP